MEINIQFYYWHEVMGPLAIYDDGKLKMTNEDILMLFSTVELYSCSTESSINGPSYKDDKILMTYNRCVNNPEASDERLRLMGTDCWVIISTKKEYEVILISNIEIVKTILDIEFETIEEIVQLNPDMGERAAYAIREVFNK
ncbi:MAG: hypothetical protein HZR80_20780 [Candidatus Heimdallarchaeota archaeon]